MVGAGLYTIKIKSEIWNRIAKDRLNWKLKRMEQVIEILYKSIDSKKLKEVLKNEKD